MTVEQMKAANADITLMENMLSDIWKKFVSLGYVWHDGEHA